MSEPKNKVILPALKSNNLAFNIFSFFEIIKALTTLSLLCKKSQEKAGIVSKYCAPLSITDETAKTQMVYK